MRYERTIGSSKLYVETFVVNNTFIIENWVVYSYTSCCDKRYYIEDYVAELGFPKNRSSRMNFSNFEFRESTGSCSSACAENCDVVFAVGYIINKNLILFPLLLLLLIYEN